MIREEPEGKIIVSEGPDDICQRCPHLAIVGVEPVFAQRGKQLKGTEKAGEHTGCSPTDTIEEGCAKNGAEAEARVREKDERVLERVGISPGEFVAGELFRRVRERIGPEDISRLCPECQWRGLGYCEEGLRHGFGVLTDGSRAI